ncbi:MAG: methylated-DNA--[protein]-cysteine S-methyltransferase [Alphaproteobacteria bacterium]|nr:methylated-DNA--[protein]-cysteine S-methyltransferase [Alphaproteobacteria bacterium]
MPQLSMHSPLGDLAISEEDGDLVAIDWGWGRDNTKTPLLAEAKRQLEAYFDGKLKAFDLPLRPAGTAFQRKVWRAMAKIPYGVMMSYGDLAKNVASAPRAIGGACGSNPIPIIVPCHRVVASGNKLHGYSGAGGLDTKLALLKLEGALP